MKISEIKQLYSDLLLPNGACVVRGKDARIIRRRITRDYPVLLMSREQRRCRRSYNRIMCITVIGGFSTAFLMAWILLWLGISWEMSTVTLVFGLVGSLLVIFGISFYHLWYHDRRCANAAMRKRSYSGEINDKNTRCKEINSDVMNAIQKAIALSVNVDQGSIGLRDRLNELWGVVLGSPPFVFEIVLNACYLLQVSCPDAILKDIEKNVSKSDCQDVSAIMSIVGPKIAGLLES